MSDYSDRDAVRTPVGKGKANGALHDVLPVDLLAHSLRQLVDRTGIAIPSRSTTSSPVQSPRWVIRPSTSPATHCSTFVYTAFRSSSGSSRAMAS